LPEERGFGSREGGFVEAAIFSVRAKAGTAFPYTVEIGQTGKFRANRDFDRRKKPAGWR
jgi:hypothetical protein